MEALAARCPTCARRGRGPSLSTRGLQIAQGRLDVRTSDSAEQALGEGRASDARRVVDCIVGWACRW